MGMMGRGGNSSQPGAASTPAPLSLIPTDEYGLENYGLPMYGGGY
jgi:hypothetical protein